jgi:hypothetical protein
MTDIEPTDADDYAIVDRSRSANLDDVGALGWTLAVAIDRDGAEHLGVIKRSDIGNPNTGFGGTIIRCSAVVDCTLAGASQLSIENANGPDYSSVIEVLPSDGAVWMQFAVLTRVP